MKRKIVALLLPVLFAAVGAEDKVSLEQQVFVVLHAHFQKSGTVFSKPVIDELVQKSGLEETALRSSLLALLDTLDHQRKEKTAAWKDLQALGGADIAEKKVGKFFQELSKSARKVLGKKKGNFALESMVGQAAKKAKIQGYQGKDLLNVVLGAGATGEAAARMGLPEKIGVIVRGSSSYRIDDQRFPGLWSLANEDVLSGTVVTRADISDIHQPVVAELVQILPKIERVKWVIEKKRAQLEPNCLLFIEINDFYSMSRLAESDDATGTVTAIYMTMRFQLKDLTTEAMVHSQKLDFTSELNPERGESLQPKVMLAKVHGKAAAEIARAVEDFLAGN